MKLSDLSRESNFACKCGSKLFVDLTNITERGFVGSDPPHQAWLCIACNTIWAILLVGTPIRSTLVEVQK